MQKRVHFPSEDALHHVFPAARAKGVSFVVGWHFAIAASAAVALIQLISVAGLHVSAGMMASSRPGIGH